jgi:hypothetical protein
MSLPPSPYTPGCDLFAMAAVDLGELAKRGKALLGESLDVAKQAYLRRGGDPETLRPLTDWGPYPDRPGFIRMVLKGTWKGPLK